MIQKITKRKRMLGIREEARRKVPYYAKYGDIKIKYQLPSNSMVESLSPPYRQYSKQ